MGSGSSIQLVEPAIFVPRIRFLGVVHWLCPYSGHFNRSHMTPWDFRLQCGGANECSRKFIPGMHLFPVARGTHSAKHAGSVPPDWVIPDKYIPSDMPDGVESWTGPGLREAFPTGDLAIVPWRAGQPTHVLVEPASTDFTPELMVRMVRKVAAAGHPDDFRGIAGVGTGEHPTRLARLGAAFELVAQELSQGG